jgi:lipoate-protein ligase A
VAAPYGDSHGDPAPDSLLSVSRTRQRSDNDRVSTSPMSAGRGTQRSGSDRAGGRPRSDRVRELPLLEAGGTAQMAIDDGLLDDARVVLMRRYRWTPPAVSLGKYQRLSPAAERVLTRAGLSVVRRPSGGRAVLHGKGFEWSFAVVLPPHVTTFGPDAGYRLVSDAFAAALAAAGVALDESRAGRYERSALCFSSPLRRDLLVGGDKVVAVAQAQRGGRVLVHGSVLERRPPFELTAALEAALGEPWRGDGLAGACGKAGGEALWRAVAARLSASLADPALDPVPVA